MLDVAVQSRRGAFALDAAFDTGDAAVTVLFGRSGSGKTSVIEAVAGLLRPDRGRVALDGAALFDSASRTDLPSPARRVGVVFQDGRLFPHMTVRANLNYGWSRVAGAERRIGFDTVIEPLGIGHLLERRPATLSGGERQRVALGRALLANPRLLLLDEPLAALDGARKAELIPLLAMLPRAFRIPILFVSHAVDEVLRLADRLVLMEDGRTLAAGAVEQVANRPEFAAAAAYHGQGGAFAVIGATIADHDERAARTRVRFAGGTFSLPRIAGQIGERVRLRIDADEVILALAPPTGLSVRNSIPARVTDLAEAGALVDVALDASGAPLKARITRAARDDLRLAPGLPIYALVKSAALAGSWTG